MSYCDQPKISNGFLKYATNLVTLHMQNCRQDAIQNGFIDWQPHLVELDITYCNNKICDGFLNNQP